MAEPILDEKNSRYTVFPITYRNLWTLYKKQQAAFWKAEEVDLSRDREDYEKLSDNEKLFIKMILAFFAQSDGIVNFNLRERFLNEVKITEAQIVYAYQMMMENIHGEIYSLMLDNIISDSEERAKLFDAMKTVDCVREMDEWALKWVKSDRSFACRVVAYCVVEGIMFQGAFAAIFWLKKFKGSGTSFMPGLVHSNILISRDEGMHKDTGVEVFGLLTNRPSKNEVYDIVKEGTQVAKNFATKSLPCKLIGMSGESMCQYLEYVADRLLVELGYDKLWNAKNPFSFMDTIGVPTKGNFFEGRESNYQSAVTLNTSGINRTTLILTEDF